MPRGDKQVERLAKELFDNQQFRLQMWIENQPKLYLSLLYHADQLIGMVHTHFQAHLRVILMKRGNKGGQKSGCQRFNAAKTNRAALTGLQLGKPLLAFL